jgi:polar amino acid transport system substrate-binding protein
MRFFSLVLSFLLLPFSVTSEEIDVVVGWNKPPYVISQENSGFEVDVARAILADMGHDLSPIYVPFGRTARLLEDNLIDLGLTQNPAHVLDSAILSDPYVVYQNVAVTRAESKFEINSIEDLRGKSIIAFQTADVVLGEAFRQIVTDQATYMEMARQDRQVDMLMLGHVDVVILDRNIFNYFKSNNTAYSDDEIVFHELFPISPYSAAIPDPELRVGFNSKLRTFIETGRYQQLLDKYKLESLLHLLPHATTP